jgi:hypothetical protein
MNKYLHHVAATNHLASSWRYNPGMESISCFVRCHRQLILAADFNELRKYFIHIRKSELF